MNINNTNYLLLERRGGMIKEEYRMSDMDNWRVYTEFRDAAGVEVCGDFQSYKQRDFRKKDHPVIKQNALYASLCYSDEDGCWGYTLDCSGLDFCKRDILTAVNRVSASAFEDIKYVAIFEVYLDEDQNFIPASLIRKYAKDHRLKIEYGPHGENYIKSYTGTYKYLCYEEVPFGDKKKKVRLFLEEVKK